MNQHGNSFSDYEVDFIKANYGSMDTGEIADKLGRPRNSILGKAFRLGLSDSTGKTRKSCTQRAKRIAERRPQSLPPLMKLSTQMMPMSADDEIVVSADDAKEPAERAVPCGLLELRGSGCRWPVADRLFCNADVVVGCSYCAMHAAASGAGYSKPTHWTDRRKRYR